LNKDSERVIFDVGKVEKIALEKNYRSTQDILDLSEVSLELEGNRYEEVETTSPLFNQRKIQRIRPSRNLGVKMKPKLYYLRYRKL